MPINFKIQEAGIWDGLGCASIHVTDMSLANGLTNLFKSKNVSSLVDLGAGMGEYTKFFVNNGINTTCYDGNPKTPELSKSRCGVLDLSKDINIGKFDWVLTLEVGEHLPKQYEEIFINNIVNAANKGIVLSWATEGQGGEGHFNERNNDYIKLKMESFGLINNVQEENLLRSNVHLSYFRKTIMVFEFPENDVEILGQNEAIV